MGLVVPQVAHMPKDYILAVNWLAIDELVNACARQSWIGCEPLARLRWDAILPIIIYLQLLLFWVQAEISLRQTALFAAAV